MMPAYFKLLPPDVNPKRVKACLGLISDTHIPRYCTVLPDTLPDIFREVDLILHAGDVGELHILDELGLIAPVVAVHGNDDSVITQQALPYQQLISIAGQRIVLCHSHYPDWDTEMERRKDDRWQSILAQRTTFAEPAGASIVVFGHSHIPMTFQQGKLLLINPGAIASPSAIGRQVYQTIALLFILQDRAPHVVHIDVHIPDQPFLPNIDWDAGFRAAVTRFCSSLIDPELKAQWQPVEAYMRKLMGKPPYSTTFEVMYEALLQISHRCWSGEQEFITRDDLLQMYNELRLDERVPEQVIADLVSLL